jgi:two-component system, NtrC family, sensor kinase
MQMETTSWWNSLKLPKVSQLKIFQSFNHHFLQLSIAKKFTYSYSFAIGIAVVGTLGAVVWGEYQERKTRELFVIAQQQQNLLAELESSVIKLRSHPQRLLPTFGKSISFEYEKSSFLNNFRNIQETITLLEEFIAENPNLLVTNYQDFQQLLTDYKINSNQYHKLIEVLWETISIPKLTLEEIPTAQQELLEFISQRQISQLDTDLDLLSEKLVNMVRLAKNQEVSATQRLAEVSLLRLYIIVFSILTSALIALLTAKYAIATITKPLENVTNVAHQITQKSDFSLQIPVTTKDEVGVLATAFNQLIHRVQEYTKQLEFARDNLEERVAERTEELQQALQTIQETQTHLIQSEKMSSLGQMVGGVAHEINNPVNFIYGNIIHAENNSQDLLNLIELYQEEYPESNSNIESEIEAIDLEFLKEDLPKVFASIKLGAERIREIVLSLRNFSRLDEAEMKKVDLHEGIDSTLVILNNRLKKGIEVIKEYGNCPLVNCYASQLNQVIMNIITNALDALEENQSPGFKPQIRIKTQLLNESEVEIGIKDNGVGIPDSVKAKLFDPFFTTKPIGKGTGLGLSICYRIIQKHQGRIEVISEPDQGTEFKIIIPIDSPDEIS